MRKLRNFLSLLLILAMSFTAVPSAFAAQEDTGFNDVSGGDWYAQAVEYVSGNGLMSGTGGGNFSPNGSTSRAMLTTILYRTAGSPETSYNGEFGDVSENAYYADAVSWAVEGGIVSGYGNGNFGPDDLLNREQTAAILWRYAGSPLANESQSFADGGQISSYALQAVNWARANGIINGKDGNIFDPMGNVTRAETAVILYNYMNMTSGGGSGESPEESGSAAGESDVIVVYFSATGNTEEAAGYIADSIGADIYEITPAEEYTSDDLDWNDPESRVNDEHENPDSRPAIAGELPDLSGYDTVFIGYPIWWGEAPNIVRTFMESVDLSGKTIIPFCTSSSSSLGQSAETLRQFAPNANWLDGQRFSSAVSREDVNQWLESLNINNGAGGQNSGNAAEQAQGSNVLIVYFSQPETDEPDSMTEEEENSTVVINGQVLGNTQYMAYVIQETTGGDIFRIEPEVPYPTDHDTLVDLAAEEQDNNARPAISGRIENFDEYDTVFVGYPNWWGDMPMIMYTFFDTYDFAGKTIIPFNTHGGSGFSRTIDSIREMEPEADVAEGLSISRNQIQDAGEEIADWVNGLNI